MSEDYQHFIKHYVTPHRKVSRDVEAKDMEKVKEDAHIAYNLCYASHGIYGGAMAVAHCQINEDDPLRFFVTKKKEIIINPVITRHTNSLVYDFEGCLSYSNKEMIKIGRWHKIEVAFYTLTKEGKLSEKKFGKLKGTEARVWQHEHDHFEGIFIFDD